MASKHPMVNSFIFDHLESVRNILSNQDAEIKEIDLVRGWNDTVHLALSNINI